MHASALGLWETKIFTIQWIHPFIAPRGIAIPKVLIVEVSKIARNLS